MNQYIKSLEVLNSWWLSLDHEWRYFLAANYYYDCERSEFYKLAESILNQQFMDDWMFEPLIPSIINHTFKTEKLLDFNNVYSRKEEDAIFSFDIKSISPIKDLQNLKELSIPNFITDFEPSFLKDHTNLNVVTLDEKFIRDIPNLLRLNLPRLEKLIITLQPYFNRADYDFLQNISNDSHIKIEELIYEDRPVFYLS